MKALGIVRRMDSLGRVVVPAEVRKTMNWETNAPLEMFTQGDALVIKKYRSSTERQELIGILRAVQQTTNEEGLRTVFKMAIEYLEEN